ncbi:DUF6428 family protein [Sinorhizobium sp. BG8]|uniref:DUF6428 family protein n=1 Tax=Sinorhizobium sp. BG8 TaxID=2613773 RepID=UPI00193D914C|nr:DUF6428 family protein [Sinorhizobium sp. BG8]QRM56917.1 hypothetical protein F3Y30_12990 [Sinorhizobium sp. BG8]
MNVHDKPPVRTSDLTLGELLDGLSEATDLPLVFHYDGRPIKSGYHVTEVKAGQFSALDCGANPEAWFEIFVQLWDIQESDRTHMPAGKFCSIIGKVSEHVKLDGSARLTFEVSDGERPMQLYCATAPIVRSGTVHVELVPRPATCKPRDRLPEEQTRSSSCCDPASTTKCCG